MILFLTVLFWNAALGQNAVGNEKQRISDLVNKLSWQSTRLEYNVLVHIYPNDEAASELIKIGKPATDTLLSALEDERKARAAHLILYVIWLDNRGIYPVFGNSEYKKKLFKRKLFAVNYEFFGLKWTARDNRLFIDKRDLEQNAVNWRERISAFRAKSGK